MPFHHLLPILHFILHELTEIPLGDLRSPTALDFAPPGRLDMRCWPFQLTPFKRQTPPLPFSGHHLSYGPPWAHYLGGYQDRLLGGPLGLLGLCHTTPDGVRRKVYS
jgi:hypothetical protein